MHKGKMVMIVVGILLVLSAAGGATIFNTHMAYANSVHIHSNNIGNHAGSVTSCNGASTIICGNNF